MNRNTPSVSKPTHSVLQTEAKGQTSIPEGFSAPSSPHSIQVMREEKFFTEATLHGRIPSERTTLSPCCRSSSTTTANTAHKVLKEWQRIHVPFWTEWLNLNASYKSTGARGPAHWTTQRKSCQRWAGQGQPTCLLLSCALRFYFPSSGQKEGNKNPWALSKTF